jgi:hypothetical protein
MFQADLDATEMSPPTDVSVGLRSAVLAFAADWLLHHCRDGSQSSAAGDFMFTLCHSATRGHQVQYTDNSRCAADESRRAAAAAEAQELANLLQGIEADKPGRHKPSALPAKEPAKSQRKADKLGTKPAGEPCQTLLMYWETLGRGKCIACSLIVTPAPQSCCKRLVGVAGSDRPRSDDKAEDGTPISTPTKAAPTQQPPGDKSQGGETKHSPTKSVPTQQLPENKSQSAPATGPLTKASQTQKLPDDKSQSGPPTGTLTKASQTQKLPDDKSQEGGATGTLTKASQTQQLPGDTSQGAPARGTSKNTAPSQQPPSVEVQGRTSAGALKGTGKSAGAVGRQSGDKVQDAPPAGTPKEAGNIAAGKKALSFLQSPLNVGEAEMLLRAYIHAHRELQQMGALLLWLCILF